MTMELRVVRRWPWGRLPLTSYNPERESAAFRERLAAHVEGREPAAWARSRLQRLRRKEGTLAALLRRALQWR